MFQTISDEGKKMTIIIASEVETDAQVLSDQITEFEFIAAAEPEMFREFALELLTKANARLTELVEKCGD